MAKVAPNQYKYIIKVNFEVDSVVDREDIIGAIFGQTDGLLGMDLDLRELQKQGKLGRIEVEYRRVGGKTIGKVYIPTTLKAPETAIIAAAVETVDRVGPAKAKFRVESIEDVRNKKREYIKERAKELFRELISKSAPDIEELKRELEESYYTKNIIEWGPEKLPAGPKVDSSDEIILVEGRADVVNLVKHGILNVVGMNGVKIPKSVVELTKKKKVTVFIDGDRGGELVLRNLLLAGADIEYVATAPSGREVEELVGKEIYKALKSKIPLEDFVRLHPDVLPSEAEGKLSREQVEKIERFLSEVFNTKEAIVINENFEAIGRDSIESIDSLPGGYGLIIDAIIEQELIDKAKEKGYKLLVGLDKRAKDEEILILDLKDIQKLKQSFNDNAENT